MSDGDHPLSGGRGEPPLLTTPFTGTHIYRTFWWAQRRHFGLGMTAGVVWMSMQALVPVAFGQAVDSGLRDSSSGKFFDWLGVVVVLFVGDASMWIIRHRISLGIFERSLLWTQSIIRNRVTDRRGGLDDEQTPGDIVNFAASDARRFAASFDIGCRGAGATVTFCFVLAAMFWVNWLLALVVMAVLLPLIAGLILLLHELERRTRVQQQSLSNASSVAGDGIGALRVVKGVGGENILADRYMSHADSIMSASLAAARIRAYTFAIDIAMSGAIVGIVAWVGGHLVADHQLSVAQLVTFSGWSVFLVLPLLTSTKWAARLSWAVLVLSASARR